MKIRNVLIVVIVTCCSYGFILESLSKSIYTINELIENTNVAVKLISNGEYTGKSVSLNVVSKLNNDITLRLPAGTIFLPQDETEQIVVLPKTELIVINKNSSKSILINGFCTESNDKSPKKEGVFKVGNTQNVKLKKLFNFIKTKDFDDHQIQESIWCITDNESIGNISEAEGETGLKEMVSEITGQAIPWQSTRREIVVDENKNILANPVQIEGQIKFETTKITKVKSKIIKENGELVHEFRKIMTIPESEDVTFNFNVKVKGWDTGNYFVVYFTDENRILVKQKFTL